MAKAGVSSKNAKLAELETSSCREALAAAEKRREEAIAQVMALQSAAAYQWSTIQGDVRRALSDSESAQRDAQEHLDAIQVIS